MNILAIHGSPRVGGNTDTLVTRLAAAVTEAAAASPGAAEVSIEHIHAARLKARPCLACGGCDETGQCVVRDDMQGVYDAVRRADALIVATPVFFASVTAQLKAVIDRFQCAWVAKYRLKEPWVGEDRGYRALLLCAGGMNVDRHFQQCRGVVRAWLAVLNSTLVDGLWFPGVDVRGDVDRIPDLDVRLAAAARQLLAWDGGPG